MSLGELGRQLLDFLLTSSGTADESVFFADGMHDDLLTQLAQLESIRVISRTSVLEYRDKEWNTREIGRELGADAILEGGVQQAGNQIRINAQLIDAHSDVHLWAEQYDRELTASNIFRIQAEIARAIAAALKTTLTQQISTHTGPRRGAPEPGSPSNPGPLVSIRFDGYPVPVLVLLRHFTPTP